MNERIEELAKECNILGEKEFAGKIVGFNYGKFAELIVQECASLFPHQFTDEKYQRRIDKTIRKHFGIES